MTERAPKLPESRRRFVRKLGLGVLGTAVVGLGEWLNLRGTFDHRTPVLDADAQLDPSWTRKLADDEAALLHIGHSTHLLQLGAARVLTDPWFFDPGHGGMWHRRGPALRASELGELDLVVITHEHPDHVDPSALDQMDKRALVVVPTKDILHTVRALGFKHVELLEPWHALSHAGVKVTATPAVHDVYEVSYVLEHAAHRVLFAGDTGLHEDLATIAERFSPTTAILPVDGTRLRTEERLVLNPEDAVTATHILKPKLVIPSHADGYFAEPVLSLLATQVEGAAGIFAKQLSAALPDTRCHIPRVGERVMLPST